MINIHLSYDIRMNSLLRRLCSRVAIHPTIPGVSWREWRGAWPPPRWFINPHTFSQEEKQHYLPNVRIQENQLKDKYLYRIIARNSSYGIYHYKTRSFEIARWKSIDCLQKNAKFFLDREYDFNCGPPSGTVVPKQELGPYNSNESDKLMFLRSYGA
jgi:hypothetical protein